MVEEYVLFKNSRGEISRLGRVLLKDAY